MPTLFYINSALSGGITINDKHTNEIEELFSPILDGAAQEFHPVMGIFALGNSVLNLTVRDDDIGWTVEAIKKIFKEKINAAFAC